MLESMLGWFHDKKNLVIFLLLILVLVLSNLLYAIGQNKATVPLTPEQLAARQKIKESLLKNFPMQLVLDPNARQEFQDAQSTSDGLELTRIYSSTMSLATLTDLYANSLKPAGWQVINNDTFGEHRAITLQKEYSRLIISISTNGTGSKFVLAYNPRLVYLDDPLRLR